MRALLILALAALAAAQPHRRDVNDVKDVKDVKDVEALQQDAAPALVAPLADRQEGTSPPVADRQEGTSPPVADRQEGTSAPVPAKEVPVEPLGDFETRNPAFTDDGEPLFEADIVLTAEQRTDRQAESNLWTGPISFAISASSAPDRAVILAGIQHWRDNTCLRFNEVAAGSAVKHVKFVKGTGCWSNLGKTGGSGGQTLSLGDNCNYIGTVVHELGHTIGLSHQQSRTDRDTYVIIRLENVQPDQRFNFAISQRSNNFSVPYDLTSIMHYGSSLFSSNGRNTIQVRDIQREHLIGGGRRVLSHRDRHLVNAMYNCAAHCVSAPVCANGGFVDASCTCVCPGNTAGVRCETLISDYYPTPVCGDMQLTTAGTVTSPNYPAKFPKNVVCVWVVTAPIGKRVSATFTDMKMLYRSGAKCPWDYLAVRYTGDIYRDDEKACDEELKGRTIVSTTNKMVIKFKSGNYGWYRGFSALLSFVSV